MSKILEGVRVVDLTRYISGPYCAMMMADQGAEVIKIERPGRGDISRTVGPWLNDVSIFFPMMNRNKKSITVDMRKPEGMDLVKKLIAESDVVVENFAAGTTEKMGLTYEELKKINPGIIMVSITGFGHAGPWKDRKAFDGIISAVSGVTRIEPDHIERSKGALHDHMAGMYAFIGALLALYEKKQTGKGQYVDVAMIASSAMIRSDAIADCFLRGNEAAMGAEDAAPYGYIPAKDGWVNFYATTDPMYHKLLELIPDDEFLHEERFYNDMTCRTNHLKELMEHISAWSKDKTCDELEAIFLEADLPCGIVATPERLLNNPQLNDQGYIMHMDVTGIGKDIPYMGSPIKLSGHPDMEYRPAPGIGDDNDEIFHKVLGLNDEEIAAYREKGIV